jgi:hypothetical protein
MRARRRFCFRIVEEVWLWHKHSDSDALVVPARSKRLGHPSMTEVLSVIAWLRQLSPVLVPKGLIGRCSVCR